MSGFISIDDFSKNEINQVLTLGGKLKKNPEKYQKKLQSKKIGLIFEKPSTRTWVSFDCGISSLGGSTVYLGPTDIKLGVREEVKDVARVLDRYLSGVVLRTYKHSTITTFKKYFKQPVINGLSDTEHPCQAMADFLTMREHCRKKNPLLCFVGDGNNVLNSLLLITAKLGGKIHYATPKGLEPKAQILRKAKLAARKTGAVIKGFNNPSQAVAGADFIYTDVWVSMGEEAIRQQKLKAFKGMQVNINLLKLADRNVKVLHCLPAHRGEGITNQVMEGKHSVVFDQAENRLHIQKAILLQLFKS